MNRTKQLEKDDIVRFEYVGDRFENGQYEGTITQLGPRRATINSGGERVYISDPDRILGVVRSAAPDRINHVGEDIFRWSGALGKEPLAPLREEK